MLLVIFLRCPHLLYDTCVGVAEIGAHRNGDLAVCHKHRSESAHDHAGACGVVEEPFHQGEDVEYEDDSEDDYEGILKPAFAVDGDPDLRVPSACQVGS